MKTIQKGFTLIELLVVIGIIAVLTGLITFNFNSARARARDVQRKNDMKALMQALEIYKNDNGQAFPDSNAWGSTWVGFMNEMQAKGVITKSFGDPKIALKSGSWQEYKYTRSDALNYTLTACLENRADSDGAAGNGNLCFGGLGRNYIVTNP